MSSPHHEQHGVENNFNVECKKNNVNGNQMNHSANHQQPLNKNTNNITTNKDDTAIIQNKSNHNNNNGNFEYVLNGNNNKIDTEIKEKEIKSQSHDQLENEPQTYFGTDTNDDETDDDQLEDWQILKKSIIDGNKVKLVPYTTDHVQTYNKWLNDPYIQQMTQTEPYSLSQEYEYQKEWNQDEKKYIFIILDKTLGDNVMAGDINIFIQDDLDRDNEHMAELNIMIAENKSRRKGLATETLQLILKWVVNNLEIKKFIAKICHDNDSSIQLFKKLGFKQTEYVETFKEYTFTLTLKNEQNMKKHHKLQLNGKHYTD